MKIDENWTTDPGEVGLKYYWTFWSPTLGRWYSRHIETCWHHNNIRLANQSVPCFRSVLPIPYPVPPPLPKEKP